MIVEHLPDDLRPYEGRKPHLFASFAYQDVPRVEPWLRALAAAGVRVWFDRGTGWDRPDALERAIARSAGILHFWSEHSSESRSVQEEIGRAREAGRAIFVVMLDSGVAPADAAAALPGDADAAQLVAALPEEVRDVPRGERRRARPSAAEDSTVSDRSRTFYILLAVFLGWIGLQFRFAGLKRMFRAQLALWIASWFVLPPFAVSEEKMSGPVSVVFFVALLAHLFIWFGSCFLARDGDGRRMPFFVPGGRRPL